MTFEKQDEPLVRLPASPPPAPPASNVSSDLDKETSEGGLAVSLVLG